MIENMFQKAILHKLRPVDFLCCIFLFLLTVCECLEPWRPTWLGLSCDWLSGQGGTACSSLIDSQHTETVSLTRLKSRHLHVVGKTSNIYQSLS